MVAHRWALVFMVPLLPRTAWAQERGVGEPCGARSDCREPLRCLKRTCVDQATFDDAPAPPRSEPLKGAFVGASLGVAIPATWKTGGEGFEASFRTGFLSDTHWQLAVDASAGTTLLINQGPVPLAILDLVATVGYVGPISDQVGWIGRVGVGGGALLGTASPEDIDVSPPLGFVEFRIDLFGVAVQTGKRTSFEFNAPSFRIVYFPQWGNDCLYMAMVSVAYDRFL